MAYDVTLLRDETNGDISEFIERLPKIVNKPWSRELVKRYQER